MDSSDVHRVLEKEFENTGINSAARSDVPVSLFSSLPVSTIFSTPPGFPNITATPLSGQNVTPQKSALVATGSELQGLVPTSGGGPLNVTLTEQIMALLNYAAVRQVVGTPLIQAAPTAVPLLGMLNQQGTELPRNAALEANEQPANKQPALQWEMPKNLAEKELRPEGSRTKLRSIVRKKVVDESDSRSITPMYEEERPQENAKLKNQVSQLKNQLRDLEDTLREKSQRVEKSQRSERSRRAEKLFRTEKFHRTERSED